MHALPFQCRSCGETKDYWTEFYAGEPTCRACLLRKETEWRLKNLAPFPTRRI